MAAVMDAWAEEEGNKSHICGLNFTFIDLSMIKKKIIKIGEYYEPKNNRCIK